MRKAIALLFALVLAFSARGESFRPRSAREGKLMALTCLMDCAFSAEYGDEHSSLLRWESPIFVYVGGNATREDLKQTDEFLMQLSFRVPLFPPIQRVEDEALANVTLYFVPKNDMAAYVSNYLPGNDGFVTYFYRDNVIYAAEIAVSSDDTTQAERNGILREELVNGFGLGKDHYRYSDSVIYEPYNTAQTLSEVDWLMLNMVYSPYVWPGMTAAEAYDALYASFTPEE